MGITVGTTVRGRDVTWGGYRTGVVTREVRSSLHGRPALDDAHAVFHITADNGRTYVVEAASEVR